MKIQTLIFVCLTCLLHQTYSQKKDSVFLPDIFIEAIKAKKSIVIDNAIIYDDNRKSTFNNLQRPISLSQYIKEKIDHNNISLDSAGKIIVPMLFITNSTKIPGSVK